ncbi:MAG: hypothetical protein P4L81_07080, partial [Candidatus Pacebacteria bacterium]|nr:hypothetical protein [Candidatus Paceibacterota bacterium]
MEVGIKRADIGDGTYLTREALNAALTKCDCPIDIKDERFARAVLLFGALLPATEAESLFEEAAALGCDKLALSGKNSEAHTALFSAETSTQERLEKVENPVVPRLDLKFESQSFELEAPNADLVDLASRLLSLNEQRRLAREAAIVALAIGVEVLLDGPVSGWNEVERTVLAARSANLAAAKVRDASLQQLDALRAEAYARAGIPSKISAGIPDNDEDLARTLIETSALVQSLVRWSPDPAVADSWRVELSDTPLLADFLTLLARAASFCMTNSSRQEFKSSVAIFARSHDTAAIAAWLGELNHNELTLLAGDLCAAPWTIGCAILLRFALDAHANATDIGFAELLLRDESIPRRRT